MSEELKTFNKPKTLLIVFVALIGGMTIYEILKQLLFPEIGIWESHVSTIIFSAITGLIVAVFLLEKIERVYRSRDKAKAEAEQANALLIDAVESIPDGFILFDKDDRLVICNQNYQRAHGFLGNNLTPGTSFEDIARSIMNSGKVSMGGLNPEDWLKQRTLQHLNPGEPFVVEYEDGTSVLVNEFQTQYGGTALIRSDITKEKKGQDELRKLSHALEQSPSMIFITDVEGIIEYINPMFTQMSGYTVDDAIGNNPRILKSGDTDKGAYRDLWKTIKTGHEWKGELKDRRKDGSTFWAYAVISPVKNEQGEITHFVAMHEDITKRKGVEMREHLARKNAEAASRAKSELLANMSHELRTPLNAIIGFSDMMKAEMFGPLNETYADYAKDISNSGSHLLQLINDILDVSAIEAGKIEIHEEELVVGNIIETALHIVRGRAVEANIKLTSHIDDSLPMFLADDRRIKQILLNLLSNAIKFTPSDGKVTLSAWLDARKAHVFTVTDTGVGMDKEELLKAMSEFGQVDSGLDRKHDGTGLGLPLTRGLVELHGGMFEVDSEKGKGTTITVRFPPERTIHLS